MLEKLPIPIAGLMLALAVLGNLLGSYSILARYILGSISAVIALVLLAKIIVQPKSLIRGFDNPVVASVSAAYPMGLMLLSTYIKPFASSAAFTIWIAAIIMHAALIFVFTKKYIFKFNIKKVFPSYFLMYVGIIAASVTSPVYQMQIMGQYIFWIGLASYAVLLPIVLYRVIKVRPMPTPSIPTLIIFAAPASLCLAGYLNAFQEKNVIMVHILALAAIIMLVYALAKMPKMMKLPFMPSYSAFTFPLVISAIALKGFLQFKGATTLGLLAITTTGIATFMVLYVLMKYIFFMVQKTINNGI